MSRFSRQIPSAETPTKVLAVVICLALLLSMTPLVAADNGQARIGRWLSAVSQGQGGEPRPGRPEGVFPNMDEMRLSVDDARRNGARIPTIPLPIPSTRRRWRPGLAVLGTSAQPSRNANVESNNLLALVSAPSKTGNPWRTELASSTISGAPFGLFSAFENAYGRDLGYVESMRNPPSAGAAVAAALTPPQGSPNFAMARIAPQNRTGTSGVDLLSGNFNWNLGLIGLRGRSGLDLGLGLSYNSKVWTASGNYINFDLDQGTPSPGFRLGFPVVQGLYYNDQAGAYFYLLITPSGQHVELRRIGASSVYQTVDATYAQLTDYGSYLIFRADGAQLKLVPSTGEYHCTEVKDRNGNYLTIAYNGAGDISTVTDTLARIINFNYDGNANLISLTQTWGGQTHSWATFGYSLTFVGNNFPGLTSYGPTNTSITTLSQVGLPDGSRYNFYYNTYGIISSIRHHAYDSHERRRTTYDLTASTTDCPRVAAQREWAENWNGNVNGLYAAGEEATTTFGETGGARWMLLPNQVTYKEFYGTGWQAGLITQSEVWSGGVKKKWTTTTWTQDNTGVSYQLNPRITETNVYDAEGNRRRTVIDYGSYAAYSLPYQVIEYAADGATMLRVTYNDYNLSSTYTDRRIIGLVSAIHVLDISTWAFVSKTTFDYDASGEYMAGTPQPATRHDVANYGASFVAGRGNLTAVTRWDVTDISNSAKAIAVKRTGYNSTGAAVFTRDALGHQTTISYSDSFSDGQNNRNTFAYPSAATDGDAFSSYVQYNFDFGAVTRTQGPPPAGQSQGAIQTMTYDAAGRIQWVVNQNNGAWKYIAYADRGDALMSQQTINAATPSYWSITVVDGANRVRAVGGDHPGSSGGYSAAFTYYDVMGRVSQQSNPAETTGGWAPTGDDNAGWFYTQQTYDWQGRPLITTNTDGTTKEASYGGCGCAGGAVVTLTDEGTIDGGVPKRRQHKTYSDVLGRTVKTEVLTWQGGSVYSATVNTYNARDQITQVREHAGAAGSGTYQDTTMTYDGYGRLKTKHVPQQNAGTATTWDYNADDTIQKITDARGASQTFGYNNRHLVSGITYAAPAGISIPGAVGFAYDAAGNRTSMTDGSGSMSYQYDQLSRLSSETRAINGLGNFTINYSYNLAGQLTSVTDPFAAQVSYAHDSAGRLTAVTGTGFPNVSTYASNIQYRASGALKHLNYGNNRTLDIGYNSGLQPASYQIPNLINRTYQYHSDGTIKYSQDLLDAKFDRSYSYDHAARMTQALSGAEARGQGPTNDRPYKETMTHDAFGHVSSNERDHWALNRLPTTDSYVNNRHAGWSYDTDGNLLQSQDPYITYDYDAAGRMSHTNSDSRVDITQTHDGDGQVLKRHEVDTIYQEGQPPYTETSTLYQLRSTALGGKVLTEIGAQGQKFKTYVYANGALLAWQQVIYLNGNVYSQGPQWEHRDPTNASYRASGPTYVDSSAELDPFGSDMGLENPYQFPPDPPLPHKPNIFYPGFGTGASNYCVADGIERSCSEVFFLMAKGWADQCENNNCGPHVFEFTPTGEEFLVPLSHDKETGAPGYYPEQWGYSWEDFLLPKNMIKEAKQQNSGVITDGELNSAGNLIDKNYDRCRKLLGAKDPEAPGREGAGLALAAAQNGVDDATMIGAIWQHESGINTIDYYGDAGPAQLTISGVRNNPRLAPLVVGNAYGTWHGSLDPKTDYAFDGSVQDNVATLRNLVRYGRAEYGSNYMTAYHYGPGYPKAPRSAKAKNNRNKYAQNIMRIYNKYLPFFECLTGP